VNKNLGTKA